MLAEKFGATDRSVKFACPPCTTIFLIDIGMGLDGAWPDPAAALCARIAPRCARSAAGLAAADLADLAATRSPAAGCAADDGADDDAADAGPVNTRFTLRLVSDSMMTRA